MDDPREEEKFSPSPLDQLVAELNHSGKSQYTGILFPVPTRLPGHLFGMVEALTHHAGTSRNKLVCQLIEVGIHATLEQLDESVVQQLSESQGVILQHAMDKSAGQLERGEA